MSISFFFFFNDTATPEIYPLSLHDALPIFGANVAALRLCEGPQYLLADHRRAPSCLPLFEVKDLKARRRPSVIRSEEHTSELQSQSNLVCRLLLEKKKTITASTILLTTASA